MSGDRPDDAEMRTLEGDATEVVVESGQDDGFAAGVAAALRWVLGLSAKPEVEQMAGWSVILEPVAENPTGTRKKNTGGLVIYLVRSDDPEAARVEVTRVAYVRRNSRNPDVPFDEVLRGELDKAQLAADEANALLDEFERARAEEMMASADRLRDLLGSPERIPA